MERKINNDLRVIAALTTQARQLINDCHNDLRNAVLQKSALSGETRQLLNFLVAHGELTDIETSIIARLRRQQGPELPRAKRITKNTPSQRMIDWLEYAKSIHFTNGGA